MKENTPESNKVEDVKKKTKTPQNKEIKPTDKVKVFVPQKESSFEPILDLASLEPLNKPEKEPVKTVIKKTTAHKAEPVLDKPTPKIEISEKAAVKTKAAVPKKSEVKEPIKELKSEPVIHKAEPVVKPVTKNIEFELDGIEHINKVEEKALNADELNVLAQSDLSDFIIKPVEQPKVITPPEIKYEPIAVIPEPIKEEFKVEKNEIKDEIIDRALISESTSILFNSLNKEEQPVALQKVEQSKDELKGEIVNQKGVSVMDNYIEKKEEIATVVKDVKGSKKDKKAKKERVKKTATGWIVFNTFMNFIFFVLILYAVNNQSFNLTYIIDFFKKLFS